MHPDLADLDFNASAQNLPPPIRPTTFSDDGGGRGVDEDRRGSLSDFSDYESSDGETYVGTSKRKNYVTVSDDSGNEHPVVAGPATQIAPAAPAPAPAKAAVTDDDPFADPFADKH